MSHLHHIQNLLIQLLNVDAEIQDIRGERTATLRWLREVEAQRWTRHSAAQAADCDAHVADLTTRIDALAKCRQSLASTLSQLTQTTQ
jgi:hypothetical protein